MDFRQRLEQSREKQDNGEVPAELEDTFTGEYFAADSMRSHPACLDLRLPQGKRKALPYSYFTELNYDTETGIEILTTRERIKIIGRNLTKLFDYLISYRVRYVQANVNNDPNDDGLFVKEIRIEELGL